ncbi:MAG TPA: hypothetical protein VKU00_06380 [Chthonomonadaceae bacterium]|nr:hypothetical protein [Chthonomonadaceae bacterium]
MRGYKPSVSRISLVLLYGGMTGIVGVAALVGCGGSNDSSSGSGGLPGGKATMDQVTRGRALVTTMGCPDCHNRSINDPSDPKWLSGYVAGTPGQPFQIGPFKTYPRNLTPDMTTGIGMHSDRQIFNALRYGLSPDDTADVTITSTTPGQGNFPATPHYLAPPMPWPSTRHLSDDDTWAIVAYLKHGIKAVNNTVPASQDPPDFWASSYTASAVGPATFPTYPAGNEQFAP